MTFTNFNAIINCIANEKMLLYAIDVYYNVIDINVILLQ